jgi:DNA polymerase-3 subunit alpha
MWIPLHNHSQYSILNSTIAVEDLVAAAKNFALSALALTDEGNMYGAIEFYKACKEAKIKPIIGCELHLAPASRHDKRKIPGTPAGFPLILLAKNSHGYQNLCKLSSIAHVEGFYYTPRIDKEVLEKHAAGLICLSGPLQGLLPYLIIQGKERELRQEIDWFQSLFGADFYFELQRHASSSEHIAHDGMNQEAWLLQNYQDYVRNQEIVIKKFLALSQEMGIRCVATQGAHYLERADWKPHEILMNIQSGEPVEIWERDSAGNPKNRTLNPKRQLYFSHELYFKSPEQMAALFADIPDSLQATVDIAQQVNLELDFKTRHYPVFTPPAGITKEAYLKNLCQENIPSRYTKERLAKVAEQYPGRDPAHVVQERLAYELDIIISKGMGDYVLIVHDFIAWAKKQGIPVGPGRGSGAGSIILYLIGITDIEPLRFNLFFERFINPERISYPDVDVDICMERRGEVIDYTVQKYGKDKVAQIVTFGTMKAKMAIKDVGRVLNIPLSKVNAVAKLVPEELGITIDKALETDKDLNKLYATDEEVKTLIDIARRLEGSVRNTGIHAAGLIISGEPLTSHIPVCTAKDSDILATQYSMKPVEAVGMLKIDFLGLKTLTSIQKTVDAIRQHHNIPLDWINLPLEDKATFQLMNQGRLSGIFQMESSGMQELARQIHIDKFEEVIAVVALYRPGPMEMIPSFVQRKHGKEQIEIDHPLMKHILAETYGIMVYQEQVMQAASLLANYTLGEGDVLRRAMGKKDREEMAKQREKFRQGALQKGIDTTTAMRIFDKIEKFASYGFNKAHAAAYGYLAYVTAYLKANFPGEWMASLMTCDRDDLTKVAKLIAEAHTMNIAILPPDINESGHEFVSTSKGIRFAMGGIKGVGEGVVEAMLDERKKKGPFKSLFDFCSRIDTKKVGKKTIEHLIEAGCFDFTSQNRGALIGSLESLYSAAVQKQRESAKGIIDLFGDFHEPAPVAAAPAPSSQHLLRREKELLGFYVTGHPLNEFKQITSRLSCVPLSQIAQAPHDTIIRIACIIDTLEIKISGKTQKKFAIATLSDGHDAFEVPIWPELYEEKGSLLVENSLLYAIVQVDKKEGDLKLQCRWFDDLSKADEQMMRTADTLYDQLKATTRKKTIPKQQEKKMNPLKLHLQLDATKLRHSHILHLKNLFRAHGGPSPLTLEFMCEEKTIGKLLIDGRWGVSVAPELEAKLQKLPYLIACQIQQQS